WRRPCCATAVILRCAGSLRRSSWSSSRRSQSCVSCWTGRQRQKENADMRLISLALLCGFTLSVQAGQVPLVAGGPDAPISASDRVYAADQFSNTVSVVRPLDSKLLGVIKLGDPTPGNLSPLYRGQLLVHGLGFSPDRKTLAVVSIGSNSVSFIGT